jgi:hypothetical protein
MRTEIDPTLTTLDCDLSQDSATITIHLRKRKGDEGAVCVGPMSGGSRAHLLLDVDADSPRIYIEIEQDDYDGPEYMGKIQTHISLDDVFDIEVESFGDVSPDPTLPLLVPHARWLRNRSGQWRRLDLS